ncbi:type II toxin-antitoxin system PemK/MazF family toxin [Aggregatibacter actinomycetemcomitans]|uniref:type II toxin-antitoxin system PemK/MazF family toxin n=1 Tax=Aggregatibacter actinomycetemcomitans TaxID=714 RepID=UPI00197B9B57|nr:type II toxin-antitoxin system PemK/MazF family toxin [Aggregatibacter actinomycetemcomitans]MBN6059376.1 type II toxin-antitoxin system PemK/MazF family toxin [Aggregatibacter actinomycetemcomitans]MBN6087877.1 type II toxin-antitoxin system PemK/MazF family toxin [Aggregatibacter actinomycetemcomitans]
MAKNKFKRGDIINICLNPVVGKEIQGDNRPALVLSNSEFHTLGFMLIAPITQGNAMIARENGFAVTLSGTGCKTQGIIIAYQARIIDFTNRNAKKIESAPAYVTEEVQDIIEAILKD